tara:strand:+ start:296 stop:682 length:387 start_codon:yes stop_codon:yes gene_type:complete
MDVLEEKVAEIKSVLTRAAKSRSIVRYPKIYSLFEDDENKTIIWATFEQACREIADPSEAIYGVLMRIKSTELPQDGFFDLFKNMRPEKYKELTGSYSASSNMIDPEKMAEIVKLESETVYNHAAKNL